jgi:hypothetical protein
MQLIIVSGGREGAERGAIEAAIELGLARRGWCSAGELAAVPAIYAEHLHETSSAAEGMAARLNVQDSDATLIISFAEERKGRAAFVGRACESQRKPCKHLVLPAGRHSRIPDGVRTALLEWLGANHVNVLNVAGHGEPREPGIQQAVRDALVWIFEDEIVQHERSVEMREARRLGPGGEVAEHTISLAPEAPEPDDEDDEPRIGAGTLGDLVRLVVASSAVRAEIANDAPPGAQVPPPSKPYRSGPLQQTHQIASRRGPAGVGSFTLRLYWEPHNDGEIYWVDFELFEVIGVENSPVVGRLLYQRAGSNRGPDCVTELADAEWTARGMVKWDGCTQFDVAPVHVDSRAELDDLFRGISEARRLCAEAMGDTFDRSGEYR